MMILCIFYANTTLWLILCMIYVLKYIFFVFTGLPNYDDDNLGPNVSSYPYFEFNVPRNVTTAVGQTAFLHCRVEQLGDKAVSLVHLPLLVIIPLESNVQRIDQSPQRENPLNLSYMQSLAYLLHIHFQATLDAA